MISLALSLGGTLLVGCSAQPLVAESSTSAPAPTQSLTATERDQVWADAMVMCLRDAGWEAEGSGGGVSPVGGVSEAQYGAYSAAVDACSEKVGTTANTTPLDQWTAEQWTELYSAETATASCLRVEGFDIPQIPSKATFVDRYQGAEPWTSYGFLPDVSQSRWNTRCPQPVL